MNTTKPDAMKQAVGRLHHDIAMERMDTRVESDLRLVLARLEELERDKERLVDVVRWTLGEVGEFPMWPDSVEIRGNPKFWWRSELRRKFDAAMSTTPTTQGD